jgi:hypothetical protein
VAIKFYFATSKLKVLIQVGDKTYHHAQVCLNGHVFSASLDSVQKETQYCEDCGKETIVKCKECESPIPGWSYNPRIGIVAHFQPPTFCRFCGKPFPWTLAKKEALEKLIEFENDLTEDDKKLMKGTIEDIINETPKTKVAALKFKHYLAKFGKEVAKASRDILVDIASETGKKIILGNQ